MSGASALEGLWWGAPQPPLWRALLWPLWVASQGYRAAAALDRALARPRRAGVPVISVGNLVVGGAGKTPVALLLCQLLLARGRRPALLSRGYGGAPPGQVTLVSSGEGPIADASLAGDEPVLLARRCPGLLVLAGRRRALLAAEAERRLADVLVLDDGLQHHELARDLDVIVLDARNPLGNGRLLPRGPLRERPEGLGRVGARGLIWFTGVADLRGSGSESESEIGSGSGSGSGIGIGGGGEGAGKLGEEGSLERPARAVAKLALQLGLQGIVESAAMARPRTPLRDAKVFLFAGIARPERFEQTVRALGADVRGAAWFRDHHRFTPAELLEVRARAAAAGADRLVTTEKDEARLSAEELRGTEALPIEVRILRGAALLEAALDRALAARRP